MKSKHNSSKFFVSEGVKCCILSSFLSNLQVKLYHDQPPNFPGSNYKPDWTTKAEFILPEAQQGIPIYRVMNDEGDVVEGATDPQVK